MKAGNAHPLCLFKLSNCPTQNIIKCHEITGEIKIDVVEVVSLFACNCHEVRYAIE